MDVETGRPEREEGGRKEGGVKEGGRAGRKVGGRKEGRRKEGGKECVKEGSLGLCALTPVRRCTLTFDHVSLRSLVSPGVLHDPAGSSTLPLHHDHKTTPKKTRLTPIFAYGNN